jgi:hypothetical protein
MNTPVKQNALYRGAYHTVEECMADKPANRGSIEYECLEFNHQPLDQ